MTISVYKTVRFGEQILEETATITTDLESELNLHEKLAALILVMRIALKQKLLP